jgi:regulator of replication initiation timing
MEEDGKIGSCPMLEENKKLREENETLKRHLVELREQIRDMMVTAKGKND